MSPELQLDFFFRYLCPMCISVPNHCKDVCSHLCLLRPGGYTCACPQGARFVEGSSTECDAGNQSEMKLEELLI